MRSKKQILAKTPLTGNNKINGYGTLPNAQGQLQTPAKSPIGRCPANGGPHILEQEDAGSVSTTAVASNLTGLSNWSFFLCSLCLAGVQFTWTVEFAYGSPYLLDLGLSKPLMSLVWLAGPLSGLLVAPIIGTYSDQLRCRLVRRRPFMLVGVVLVVMSLMMVGFAREAAFYCVIAILDMPAHYSQDEVVRTTRQTASMLAVVGFYILDFSINTIQASCRALILDCAPAHQQGLANSWAGRMIGLGNVAGYFVGFLNLPRLFPFLGYGQVSVLCSVASIVLCLTVLITSISVEEKIPESVEYTTPGRKSYAALVDILKAIRHMPNRVQQVCNIQFFAWLGWFPVLFYSTTWVTEVMARGEDPEWSDDFFERATRAGSFSLLLFAIVSLVSSILLPLIFIKGAAHGGGLPEGSRIATVSPKDIWGASHFLFAALMLATLFVESNVRAAQYILAGCGVCWAVAMWVPFTLIGTEMRRAELREVMDDAESVGIVCEDIEIVNATVDGSGQNGDIISEVDGCANLLENGTRNDPVPQAFSAGVLLGIHNVYIVVPQFVTSLLAAAIFVMFAPGVPAEPQPPNDWQGRTISSAGAEVDSVGWVLRIGGLSAVVAGVLTRTRL